MKVVSIIKFKRKMIKGVLRCQKHEERRVKGKYKGQKGGRRERRGDNPYIHETKRKAKPKNRALS